MQTRKEFEVGVMLGKTYWKVFQSYFSEKEKKFLEVRFNDINFLGRRPIMHIRSVTRVKIDVTMHAINWLRKRIECSKVEEELR